MNAIYHSLTKSNILPAGEFSARRVLLIQQADTSLENASAVRQSSDRLGTVATKLAALSEEQNFTSLDMSHSTEGLLHQANKTQANILVLNVAKLNADLIAQLLNISELAPLPVIVFAREHCAESAENLVGAGIASYKVGCSGPAFDATDLAVILDVAETHFAHLATLKSQLKQTQMKLDDRKYIERAKGVLMHQHDLSEDEAYAQMRRSAMNQGRSLGDLARSLMKIVESAALAKG